MSSESASFTRLCPQCGRRVPLRLTECRCGLALEPVEVGSAEPRSAPGARVKWVVAAAALAAVVGAAVVLLPASFSRTEVPTQPEKAAARRVEAVKEEVPQAAVPAEWPRNVPYLDSNAVRSEDAGTAAVVAAAPVAAPEQSLERIVAASLPAVVLVETPGGRGTGFFASADAVLTNAHVVEGSAYVTLKFASGERLPARVGVVAHEQDLAVLRLPSARAGVQALPLGTLQHVRVGQEVLAIGSPLGLQNTVTRGIVSAVRRAGAVTLIQTDAAINPGNSGGPLLDRSGRVVGIATMKVGDRAESLAFAVAIDHARALLETGSAIVHSETQPRPAPALDLSPSQPDAADEAREQGLTMLERVAADAARRADALDDYWGRFARVCLIRPVRTSGDREWFAIWERSFPADAVSPACVRDFDGFREAAEAIRARLVEADEAARQAGVYPGSRRQLRARYRLGWDGWER